jgi:cyanate lyase
MTREEVTAIIVAAKTKKNVTWKQLAEAVGQSSVWTTAALLGQMSMTADEAKTAGELLGLSPGAIAVLQTVPARGSLPQAVPTDPLIYRFYEIVQVYGTTLKSLIEEEFDRVPDPKGDRVKVTLNGKFLPYKRF